MNPREAIRLLVFVVLLPWAKGCSSTGSDYIGEWVCQEAPSSTLQIKSDGTYRLDQPDGIPTLIEGEWKVDKDPFPHVVLYLGKTMTPEIIGEMRGGDLVDRLRGLTWVRKGKAAHATPASTPSKSPTSAAPAGQSGEIRAEVDGSTVATKFGLGWYETPMPIINFDGRLIGQTHKLSYLIPVEFRNLGPRAVRLSGKFELKVNTGYVYSGEVSFPRLTDPGKTAGAVLEFEVPPGMTPAELNGEIGQTPVRLNIPAKPIAEATVKVPVNIQFSSSSRGLKVLRCEMAGFGNNPALTVEYENTSDEALGLLFIILCADTDGKITRQGDLRGPVAPGRRENLVYRIAAAAPQNMVCCGVELRAWDGRGLAPAYWPAPSHYDIFGNFIGRPISEWVGKLTYPLIGPISGGAQKDQSEPPGPAAKSGASASVPALPPSNVGPASGTQDVAAATPKKGPMTTGWTQNTTSWEGYDAPVFDALVEQAVKLSAETREAKAQAVTPRMLFGDASRYAGRLVTISGVLKKINIVRAPARLASKDIASFYECYVRDAQDEAGPTAIAVVIDNPALQEKLTDAVQVTGFFYRLRPFSEPENTGYRPVLVARRLEPAAESSGPARPASPAGPAARPAEKPAEAATPRPSDRVEPASPPATWGFGRPVKDEPSLTWGITQAFAAYNAAMGGFHPGEDWNLPGDADRGKPVYAVADGSVRKVSPLQENLGWLITLQHDRRDGQPPFRIPAKGGTSQAQVYEYSEEPVNRIYSVYVHVEPVAGIQENVGVRRGQIIGRIADITPLGPHLHLEIRHQNMNPSQDWALVLCPPQVDPARRKLEEFIPRSVRIPIPHVGVIDIGSGKQAATPPESQGTSPDTSNWAKVGSRLTGYYLKPQGMVDGGLRDPSAFIDANRP